MYYCIVSHYTISDPRSSYRDQMIRAMYDSRRLIGRFVQDDSRKNGDDLRTDGLKIVVFETSLATQFGLSSLQGAI